MITYTDISDTYFETQASALQHVYDNIHMQYMKNHYEIVFPDHLWCEHIMYGHNRIYHLDLKVKRTGNPARKALHISLYRMDSGKYELTYYVN
jgi:hypothetical protein